MRELDSISEAECSNDASGAQGTDEGAHRELSTSLARTDGPRGDAAELQRCAFAHSLVDSYPDPAVHATADSHASLITALAQRTRSSVFSLLPMATPVPIATKDGVSLVEASAAASPAASSPESGRAPSPWSSAPFPVERGLIDARIKCIRPLIPPACLLEELPTPPETQAHIIAARRDAQRIIQGKDDRLLVIIGPCSIHDPAAAVEYARKLLPLAQQYKGDLQVCMRAYLEKPRTTIGWKGLVNDPDLDGTCAINSGLRVSRKLLLELNEIGLPLAMEMLDTITPQFLADLISWAAIGARTTESQLHRELVSGLSTPVGFKNGTTGSCKIATDAIVAARSAHSFLGVTSQGLAAIVETSGNPDCHLVLRGADSGPNYARRFVDEAVEALKAVKAPLAVMIDASHGNSCKDHRNQLRVIADVAEQLAASDHPNSRAIVGVMVESNLVEGHQKLECGPGKKAQLKYGQSVTDACISWDETERVLAMLAEAVQARRKVYAAAASSSDKQSE